MQCVVDVTRVFRGSGVIGVNGSGPDRVEECKTETGGDVHPGKNIVRIGKIECIFDTLVVAKLNRQSYRFFTIRLNGSPLQVVKSNAGTILQRVFGG